jgi:twitching motility protein PilI
MANRDALRELQSRLAARLQAAQAEGPSIAWLAVHAGAGRYLMPLAQSGEIFPWAPMQPVPYTRPWFWGVANLRGSLSGVIDLAAFLAEAYCSLLALNAALDVNVALVVDRLAGLRSPDAFVSSSPPAEGAPGYFGSLHTDAQGEVWQEIHLLSLSQSAQFLSISA